MKKIFSFIFFLVISQLSSVSFAINTVDTGYQISIGQRQGLTPYGSCSSITNNHASNVYFIPTKTSVEYSTFLNHPPTGVVVGACASCTAQTTNGCTLSAVATGSTSGACASGCTGTCSFSCSDGAWSQVSNSCSCPSTITIVSATYGANCGQFGNRTTWLAGLCNGKTSCSSCPLDLGDPAFGCSKNYVINYTCGGTAKSYTGAPEAGWYTHTISCP